MKISLILTGGNRQLELDRFFESILNARLEGFSVELIFVNQTAYSPPGSALLRSGIMFTEINSGRLGLSAARNLGLSVSTGDIIGFPDDDCWYPSDLLLRVSELFARETNTDLLCCNVFDPVRKISYGRRPLGITVKVSYYNLFRLPISVGIFVRRSAVEKAGFYFNELFGVGATLGSGEETELVFRLLKSGANAKYIGKIQVYHPVPTYQHSDVSKHFSYSIGYGFLVARIVRNGHLIVLKDFLGVAVLSLGGTLVYLSSATHRALYWFRLKGLIFGFLLGLRKEDPRI